MPYGALLPEMETFVQQHVLNKVVWDLGSGDLHHAMNLLRLGAQKIIAVDKEGFPSIRGSNIFMVKKYFHDLVVPPDGIEVAWLSWPTNHHLVGLTRLLGASQTVLYLGSNMDGNSCGDQVLFLHLLKREVLHHVPNRRNSLIVYGPSRVKRDPLEEEQAALDPVSVRWFS